MLYSLLLRARGTYLVLSVDELTVPLIIDSVFHGRSFVLSFLLAEYLIDVFLESHWGPED